jgi:O-antigen/teichoic acid export membrane protein
MNATEQAILQASGRVKLAVLQSGWSTSTALIFTFVAVQAHSVFWCAVGVALGPLLEWSQLRRLNARPSAAPTTGEPQLPWQRFGVLTVATAGIFFSSIYDQALLAQAGPRLQALWGLASRAPSFLTLSLVAAVGALSTVLVARSQGSACPELPRQAYRMARKAFLASAGVLGAMALAAVPLTHLLYERGTFGPEDTQAVAHVTRVSVFAFLWYPPLVVLLRAVGARNQIRVLALSALTFVGVKGALGWWAQSRFGLLGVSGSTGIAMAAQVFLLGWSLRQARNG